MYNMPLPIPLHLALILFRLTPQAVARLTRDNYVHLP